MKLTGPQRVPLVAGAAVRRIVRRRLLTDGVPYTEERGFLNSLFVIDIPADRDLNVPDEWIAR